MGELIERLRDIVSFIHISCQECGTTPELLTESAAEIERLRAQIAALENPSFEMCRAAIVAWDDKAVESDEAGMKAALQAAAAYLNAKAIRALAE